jgi:hypothetical protein
LDGRNYTELFKSLFDSACFLLIREIVKLLHI